MNVPTYLVAHIYPHLNEDKYGDEILQQIWTKVMSTHLSVYLQKTAENLETISFYFYGTPLLTQKENILVRQVS